ncbi:MAG: hypothetical protein EBV69_06005, partial [Oxalobacteraceae bacterium]|nr:hypothetical protein [Oxalobacteraceae bacterium]
MTSGSFSFIPKVSPNAVTVSGNISGSGNLNLNALGGSNNAGLNFNRSNDLNYAGTISGAGTVTKLGGGALTLSGSNTYSGTTTVSEGTLQIGAGGTSGDLTSVSIINNALLSFSRSDDLIYAGTISGSGTFTKSGTGTLTLSGNNTYSGTTTISGGTLQIGAGDASGSLLSNSIINNAALSFNRSDSYNYGGSISGTGILTKAGVGTLTLSSNNTYSGGTALEQGLIRLGSSTQVTNRLITAGPIGTGALDVKSGATLDLNGNTLANALVLSGQGQSNQGALINTSTSAATVLGDITLTADTTMATRGDLVFSSIDGTTGLGNSASLGIKTQPLSQWTSLTISSDSSDPYRLTLKTSPSLGLGPGDVVRFSKLVGGKLSEGFGVVTSVNDAAASELSIRTDFKIAGSSEFSIDKVDTTAPKLSLKSLESNASSRITIDRALALGGLTVDSQVALKVTGQQIATIGSQSFSGPVVIDNASIGGPCASTWLLECYFNEQIFSNPTVFSSLKGSIDFQSTLNSYTASPSNRSVLITHGNVAGVSTENPALRFSDSVGVQGEFGAFIAKAPSIAIGPTNSSLKAKAIELKVALASGITAIPSVILNGQVTLEPTVSRLTITSEGGSLVTSGGFLSKAIDQELSISLASTTSGVNTAGTLWADKSWASPQLPFGQVTVTASKFSSYGSEFCSVLDPLNCSAKSQTVSVYTNKLHAKLESPTSVLRDEFLINKAAAEEAAAKAAAEAAAKKAAEEAAAKAAAEAAAKKAAEE